MSKLRAQLVKQKDLPDVFGPGKATGVIWHRATPEDIRLFNKHVRDGEQPTAPNRAGRRRNQRLKQRAITNKKGRQ
jgi:hypothetical protein